MKVLVCYEFGKGPFLVGDTIMESTHFNAEAVEKMRAWIADECRRQIDMKYGAGFVVTVPEGRVVFRSVTRLDGE